MSSFWNSPAWTMAPRAKTSNKKQPLPGPGPGNYASATNVGKHNPAWKIGEAQRDNLKPSEGPGPGDYNLFPSKSGPKITISSKPKPNPLSDALQPGPGNYNVTTDAIFKNTTAFTMGAKYGSRQEDPEPGPGTYHSGIKLKQTGPKIGTSKRGGLEGKGQGPGPGQYAESRPFSAGPKYGFGNQAKSFNGYDQRPGPGQYEVGSSQHNLHGKGCTIGQKFTKKSTLNSGPGPGSYQMGMKRPQSGTKIGKASRITYNDGIGPGPGAYEQLYKSKGSEIKIGTSTRNGFNRNTTPGPGAYDLGKEGGKGVSILGNKSKQAIEVTPGPGAYELIGDDLKRPCSAKIGRGQRSNMGANDTPGPGQYYPHDSNNYKFAYTKEPRSKDLKGGDPGPGQYEIPPTVPSAPHYLIDPSVYRSYG